MDYEPDYGLDYNDVYLIQQRGIARSRSRCDTSVTLGNQTFNLPVVASNMKTVISESLAEYFVERGMFYIMHRFGVNQVEFAKRMRDKGMFVSISTGITDESRQDLQDLLVAGIEPEYITLDVAHGYAEYMREPLKFIRQKFPNTYLIAGNVSTYNGAVYLAREGVDCVKVGIAVGSVCITRQKTGFSVPIFSSILDCQEMQADYPNVDIIADGGVKYHGDIAKALVAGARMVMAGGLFAGYDESPGETIILQDGTKSKAYFGSASEYNKGRHKNVEGRRIFVPCRGPMEALLDEIKEDLQSSISYAGGTDLSALARCVYGVYKGAHDER